MNMDIIDQILIFEMRILKVVGYILSLPFAMIWGVAMGIYMIGEGIAEITLKSLLDFFPKDLDKNKVS